MKSQCRKGWKGRTGALPNLQTLQSPAGQLWPPSPGLAVPPLPHSASPELPTFKTNYLYDFQVC